MMTENASIPGENTAGPIKKGGRHCSVRPPNNQTNQPLSLSGFPGGKTKNPPVPFSELNYMTPKAMPLFNFILKSPFPAFRRRVSAALPAGPAPHAHC
jgi:hypothetical protein